MSIKRIAELSGVSPATVSRVLNHPEYKCQSPEVRERIWKAAMQLGYTPNQAARNLKLGIAAEQKNYYIGVLMTRTENLDRIIDEMYRETICVCDGLIIIGKCNKEALKKLNKKYKCVVSVNRNSTNYEVDEVLCDGRKVASMAVEYLISLGHRNIGYVGECYNEARYAGFLENMRKHEIEPDPSMIIQTHQTETEGFHAMQRIFREEDRPTGIYCANDITAVGMLKCLAKYKNYYYTPSIISSDDIEEAQCTRPMLTTVSLPREEMGKFAMQLLLDRLRGGHRSVVRLELEGRLMIRDSCAPADESGWSDYCI